MIRPDPDEAGMGFVMMPRAIPHPAGIRADTRQ
jgi:hypothetical protein